MKFTFLHNNINVVDIERSIAFYGEALGLREEKRKVAEDGSFILAFLGDGETGHQLELTWLKDHPDPYELGENESHIAFRADDFDTAHAHHKAMGCICFENTKLGVYFIEDPDGYWIEILPLKLADK